MLGTTTLPSFPPVIFRMHASFFPRCSVGGRAAVVERMKRTQRLLSHIGKRCKRTGPDSSIWLILWLPNIPPGVAAAGRGDESDEQPPSPSSKQNRAASDRVGSGKRDSALVPSSYFNPLFSRPLLVHAPESTRGVALSHLEWMTKKDSLGNDVLLYDT